MGPAKAPLDILKRYKLLKLGILCTAAAWALLQICSSWMDTKLFVSIQFKFQNAGCKEKHMSELYTGLCTKDVHP